MKILRKWINTYSEKYLIEKALNGWERQKNIGKQYLQESELE